MKIKEQAKKTTASAKRVATNAEQFVQAASLLIVTGFSYYALQNTDIGQYLRWVVTVALVVIGLRGAVELIKFLDKEG